MYHIELFLLFVAVASAHKLFDDEWKDYKAMFGKTYKDELDELNHFSTYLENKKNIEEHNRKHSLGLVSYEQGVNQFSDLTYEEFSKIYLSPMLGDMLKSKRSESKLFKPSLSANVPAAIDWREKGLVTRIKNQGQCGSCYTFSSTGALEAQYANKTGKLVEFSEQELLDCNKLTAGCWGGWMSDSFIYVKHNKLSTEKDYPYDGIERKCRRKDNGTKVSVSGSVMTPLGDEEALKEAVATIGPISVTSDVPDSMKQFKGSAVYHDEKCRTNSPLHAMLVVGYGSDPAQGDYWIIKNSWGTQFGDNGYIKIARNKNNLCGIATNAVYPIVV